MGSQSIVQCLNLCCATCFGCNQKHSSGIMKLLAERALTHNIWHVSVLSLTPWCRVLLEKLTGLQLVKKIPHILWNPKVHYRTHKRPPPVPVLGQLNPVHIPTSHPLEFHANIIHPSSPRSPQWSLSLRFPHQDRIRPPPHPYAPHAQPITFFSVFITRTILDKEYRSFSSSLCSLLHTPVTSSLLGPNILHNPIFSNTPSFLSSLNVSEVSFT